MYIDKNWYNEEEINTFLLERNELILETADARARMKLARAARRTARRRAFIRKLRERKRKLNPALKKRAYNQVKTAFRKRLFKGPWKKLSYATRARIDSLIQKKKPILNRIVKRIMPSVRKGESDRLRKLNQRKAPPK
jgi:hypothetical protein